jgi:hypothetical protein
MIPKWRAQFRALWEAFANGGDAAPLLAFLREHPEAAVHCGHDYPQLHRVMDVMLDGKPYRLLRCATCGEELTLAPLDASAATSEGVPYWLNGVKLLDWVEDERRSPAEEPVDWERYR